MKIIMMSKVDKACIALMMYCSLVLPAVGQAANSAPEQPAIHGASVFAHVRIIPSFTGFRRPEAGRCSFPRWDFLRG
jgi:hypothetical protein